MAQTTVPTTAPMPAVSAIAKHLTPARRGSGGPSTRPIARAHHEHAPPARRGHQLLGDASREVGVEAAFDLDAGELLALELDGCRAPPVPCRTAN